MTRLFGIAMETSIKGRRVDGSITIGNQSSGNLLGSWKDPVNPLTSDLASSYYATIFIGAVLLQIAPHFPSVLVFF